MRPIAVLASLAVLLAGPLSAAAGTVDADPGAPAAATASEGVTPAKLALVRRYLAAVQYERLMDQMMGAMLPMMVEGMAAQHPEITSQKRQEIAAAVRDVVRDTLTPRIMDRMAPIYAETFSEAELRSIVDFYESPAGRAVTAKTPTLAPKAAQAMRELLPEIQSEMLKRVCERLDCPAAPGARHRAS